MKCRIRKSVRKLKNLTCTFFVSKFYQLKLQPLLSKIQNVTLRKQQLEKKMKVAHEETKASFLEFVTEKYGLKDNAEEIKINF